MNYRKKTSFLLIIFKLGLIAVSIFNHFLIGLNFSQAFEKEKFSKVSKFEKENFASGELLIKVGNKNRVNSLFKNFNREIKNYHLEKIFRDKNSSQLSNIYKLSFSEEIDILKLANQISKEPGIEWAQPNYIRKVTLEPNDVNYHLQWALPKIQAPQAWNVTTGTTQTAIAVIDTGVDWDHPDLADNIWVNEDEVAQNGLDDDNNGYIDDAIGYDFVSVPASSVAPGEDPGPRDNDPMDFHGHGTLVSGIIAAVTNNITGVAGTCWNCKIMILRAGYKSVDGRGYLEDEDSALAIQYAVDNGAHIINMSWGDLVSSNIIQTAIDYAYNAGLLLVAAAGNSNTSNPFYPAAYPNVIAVAALDQNDKKTSYSNFGSWIDVSAPGNNIYTTVFDNGYAYTYGTSVASPFVAGLAGLLKSFRPNWTHDQLRVKIKEKVDDIGHHLTPGDLGTGRINAYQTFDPPNCQISEPMSNTWYGRMITVSATVEDNSEITQVFFEYATDSINGQGGNWFNIVGSPIVVSPFALTWQTEPQIGIDSSVWLRCQAKDNENIFSPYAFQEIKIDNEIPANAIPTSHSHSLNAWSNDNTVEIAWVDNPGSDGLGSGIAGYFYKWITSPVSILEEIINTTETLHTSPALVDDDNWYFHLGTVDRIGNWTTQSASLGPFKINAQPPSKPIDLHAFPGNNRVDLSWSANTEEDLAGYKIYRALSLDGPYDLLSTPNPATATVYSDLTAINGVTYYYKVNAYDDLNNISEFSDPSNPATPQAPGGGGGGGGGGYVFLPDVSPPTDISILINEGTKRTTSQNVTLTLKAIEADWMMISNDPEFTNALWETYTSVKSWLLTPEAGIKTVYAKFKDKTGNVSEITSSIIEVISPEISSPEKPERKEKPPKIPPQIFRRNLAKEQEFVKKWQGFDRRMPTTKEIQVGVYGIERNLAAEIAFVKKWDGKKGRLPNWKEILAGVYYQEPIVIKKRNLTKEQEFVKNWQGLGGKLPTSHQIQVGVYEIGRNLFQEIVFVQAWKGKEGRLPTHNEIIAGVY